MEKVWLVIVLNGIRRGGWFGPEPIVYGQLECADLGMQWCWHPGHREHATFFCVPWHATTLCTLRVRKSAGAFSFVGTKRSVMLWVMRN